MASIVLVWLALGAASAAAQDAAASTAEQAIANARKAYGPPPPKPTCDPQEGDEIVVCAEEQEQSQFRVKSSAELDPTSEEAVKDSIPSAPDVGGPGIFTGPATVGGLCFIPPCPKEAALIIDVTALPKAPPGSDADRIARGLPPLGRDQTTDDKVDELPAEVGTSNLAENTADNSAENAAAPEANSPPELGLTTAQPEPS